MWENIKTVVLLAALDALFLAVGGLIGHRTGLIIAAVIAVAMNAISYWKSDRIAVLAARAREVDRAEAPELHRIVEELSVAAGTPVPRIYIADDPSPNAFATGRNPAHAAVCCTTGILQLCSPRELRGVLAHELSHVRHRDILISSMAATIALAISLLAQMAQFALLFGGVAGRNDEEGSPLLVLLVAILAVPAAVVIQLAISRAREYEADHGGALLSRDPLALADALRKLEARTQRMPMQVAPAMAPLYIVNPLGRGAAMARLFSTHPPIEERVARLERMAGRGI